MMDINNSYQSKSDFYVQKKTVDDFDYDLRAKKQEIKRVTAKIKQDLLEKWKEKYADAKIFPAQVEAMHPEVVNFLLSFNLVSVYDDIAKQANLDEKGRDALPQIVWEAAKTKNWSGVERELQKQNSLDPRAKNLVLEILEQKILSKLRVLSEKPIERKASSESAQKKEEHISLREALNKFPNLIEQNITINQLNLRYSPTLMRPSIRNWITDFRDNLGAGKHSSIDRGNYLFHSENAKKLTSLERQKLSNVLKSLDEGTPLTIDAEKQAIIFENNEQRSMADAQKAIGNQPHVANSSFQQMMNQQKAKDIGRGMDNVQQAANDQQAENNEQNSHFPHDMRGDIFRKYDKNANNVRFMLNNNQEEARGKKLDMTDNKIKTNNGTAQAKTFFKL